MGVEMGRQQAKCSISVVRHVFWDILFRQMAKVRHIAEFSQVVTSESLIL